MSGFFGGGSGGAPAASDIQGRARGTSAPVAAGGSTFTIAHGLGSTPVFASVHPRNLLSAALYTVTADATNITVTYLVAPSPGALSFYWSAEL